MIVCLMISVVDIAAINRAATSTAEETHSHTTNCIRLCMLEVQSFVLLLKKVILKRFTDLFNDFVGYAVGIFVLKFEHSYENC